MAGINTIHGAKVNIIIKNSFNGGRNIAIIPTINNGMDQVISLFAPYLLILYQVSSDSNDLLNLTP